MIAYGQFINDIVGFVIVALAVFLMVKQVNRLKRPSPAAARRRRTAHICLMAMPHEGDEMRALHVGLREGVRV